MAGRNPGDAQFDDLERRDLLHAGRSGYRCGRIALNLGLQAEAKTPSRPPRPLGEDQRMRGDEVGGERIERVRHVRTGIYTRRGIFMQKSSADRCRTPVFSAAFVSVGPLTSWKT